MMRKQKKLLLFVCLLLLAGTGAVAAGGILWQSGKYQMQKEQQQVAAIDPERMPKEAAMDEDGTILFHNERYQYNKNRINMLFLGVDRESFSDSKSIADGESGQADTLILLSLDTKTGESTVIPIPRDTIAEVNAYTEKGTFTRTRKLQICMAYAYGDGKEKSCENTIRSVSRLFYGIPIHSYVALDLKAIGILNDIAGGIQVEVLEDLTREDPVLKKGEQVLLKGQQAEIYVRSRISEGPMATIYSNADRMERQKQYLSVFANQVFQRTKQDLLFPVTLYEAASDYMVTDMTASQVLYDASLFLKYGLEKLKVETIPGKAKMGKKYVEYHVKEKEFYPMVLDIFYQKVSGGKETGE